MSHLILSLNATSGSYLDSRKLREISYIIYGNWHRKYWKAVSFKVRTVPLNFIGWNFDSLQIPRDMSLWDPVVCIWFKTLQT